MGDFGQFSVMARVGAVDCDYATRGYPFDRAKCVFTPYYCKVVAHNQSRENGRVRRVLLNGVELRERRLRHADLVAGGTLEFEMEPDSER